MVEISSRRGLVLVMVLAGCGGTAPAPQTPAKAETPENPAVRACVAGDLDRCKEAADYLKGPGASAGGPALMTRWRTGCDNGNASDCYRSAMAANIPIVVIELVDRACVGGIPLACWKIGKALNHVSDIGDAFDAPIDALTHACNRDERSACIALAGIFWIGRKDVIRDPRRAFAFLRIACDRLHDEPACGQSEFLECKQNGVAECSRRRPHRDTVDAHAAPKPRPADADGDDSINGIEGGIEGGVEGVPPEASPPPPPPPPRPRKLP